MSPRCTFPAIRLTPAGFTLVELLIALVLLLVVAGAGGRLLAATQRATRAQVQQAALQDAVRTGALLLADELGALGYDEVTPAAIARFPGSGLVAGSNPDLLVLASDSVTYRGFRALGFTCAISVAGEVVLRNTAAVPLLAVRPIAATDSVMLFVENDPATSDDDLWLTTGLTVEPDPAPCPDGSPGVRLRLAIPVSLGVSGTALAANLMIGGPVRAFEITQVRSYVSAGRRWLGLQARPGTGTVIEPVLGPLSDGGLRRGLALAYTDAGGAATAVPDAVRSIEATLEAVSEEPVWTTGRLAFDTLASTSRIALRNALRP
jgi:prepilin-type N-terminal cleavage/methylation domain-containing protein